MVEQGGCYDQCQIQTAPTGDQHATAPSRAGPGGQRRAVGATVPPGPLGRCTVGRPDGANCTAGRWRECPELVTVPLGGFRRHLRGQGRRGGGPARVCSLPGAPRGWRSSTDRAAIVRPIAGDPRGRSRRWGGSPLLRVCPDRSFASTSRIWSWSRRVPPGPDRRSRRRRGAPPAAQPALHGSLSPDNALSVGLWHTPSPSTIAMFSFSSAPNRLCDGSGFLVDRAPQTLCACPLGTGSSEPAAGGRCGSTGRDGAGGGDAEQGRVGAGALPQAGRLSAPPARVGLDGRRW